MRITRFDLPTNNLPQLRAFYAHQLGLPLIKYTDQTATFQVGWTTLVLRHIDEPTAPGHFALNIPLYTLEQYQLWYDLPYLDTGAPGRRITHFPDWKARACYFRDSDGNIVEFIERQDAGFAESVGGYFQGISEIGLATKNVGVTTDLLVRQFGLPQFAKTRPQADFNAVGDDYGLLILAQTGRSWLFTDVPATAGHWRAEFSNRQGNRMAINADAYYAAGCCIGLDV